MEERFPVGHVGVVEVTVTHEITAAALGNVGVDVMATPWLTAFAEQASVRDLMPYLAPGESTVGTRLEIFHLAATPVGMKITVRSRLERVEGRRLYFRFEAYDEVEKVAEGTHDRVVVDLERILTKARAKRKS